MVSLKITLVENLNHSIIIKPEYLKRLMRFISHQPFLFIFYVNPLQEPVYPSLQEFQEYLHIHL